eukprot:2471215-Prymnesium_polylepis.2
MADKEAGRSSSHSSFVLAPHTRVWIKAPVGSPRPFFLGEVISAEDAELRVRLQDGAGAKIEHKANRSEVFLAEPLGPDNEETNEADNCSLTNLSDAR